MQMRTYRWDDRVAKRALLDEMEVYTGMHGKSIIRRFDGPLEHQPHRQERGAEYGPEPGAIRAVIWEATNYVSRTSSDYPQNRYLPVDTVI